MQPNNPGPPVRRPPPDLDAPPPTWFQRLRHVFRREMSWFDGFLHRWFRRAVFVVMHTCFLLAACYIIVFALAYGRTYDRLSDVPPRVCGVVLGCAKKVGKSDNVFFTNRIAAAAELYRENKIQFLLVSGRKDKTHDEPTDMKAALVALGIPANRIYCDYAGFRTLDSIIRARKIFGLVEFTIISQRFHNERALYMARRLGLGGCIAYNATDADLDSMWRMYGREAGARAMAILDVEVLDTQPKAMGGKVTISEKSPPVDEVVN